MFILPSDDETRLDSFPDSQTHTESRQSNQNSPDIYSRSGTMRVIVFTSQKGGSGKTTLCGQLAVQAELSGAGPVAVIDTDPQGSLSDWWNAREQDTPVFVKTSTGDLKNDLLRLQVNGIRLVLIDTPPSITEAIEQIVSHADLVVVPTRPSPHDLRAVGPTIDIVEFQGKPLVFAINGASARARITGETAVALSQHGTVAPVVIHHRNDFVTSMIRGGAVVEKNPNARSSKEVTELWDYINSRLGKVDRRIAHVPFDGLDRRNPNQGQVYSATPHGTVFGRRGIERKETIQENNEYVADDNNNNDTSNPEHSVAMKPAKSFGAMGA